jgi:hypothetical protein
MGVGAEEHISAAAELFLSFVDQVRREATRHMSPDPRAKDPLQLAYEGRLSSLSDLDRRALVRVLQNMMDRAQG